MPELSADFGDGFLAVMPGVLVPGLSMVMTVLVNGLRRLVRGGV